MIHYYGDIQNNTTPRDDLERLMAEPGEESMQLRIQRFAEEEAAYVLDNWQYDEEGQDDEPVAREGPPTQIELEDDIVSALKSADDEREFYAAAEAASIELNEQAPGWR